MFPRTGGTDALRKEGIVTKLTMNDVFDRVVAIAEATDGGARGGTILNCDIVHQEGPVPFAERSRRADGRPRQQLRPRPGEGPRREVPGHVRTVLTT